jgi:hypothetical protein
VTVVALVRLDQTEAVVMLGSGLLDLVGHFIGPKTCIESKKYNRAQQDEGNDQDTHLDLLS